MVDVIDIKSGEVVDTVPKGVDPTAYIGDLNRLNIEHSEVVEDAYKLDEEQLDDFLVAENYERLKEAINNEAQRRICVLINATSLEDCLAKQQSYSNRLLAIQVRKTNGGEITEVDRQTESFILQGYAGVEHIIARSNKLLNSADVPDDFTDDRYWE